MKYKLCKDMPGFRAGEDDFELNDNKWTLSGTPVIEWKQEMFFQALDEDGYFQTLEEDDG